MKTGLDRNALTAADYHRAYVAERRRQFEAGEVTVKHGTVNTYTNYGCRCGACREAKVAYNRDRRESERARVAALEAENARMKAHIGWQFGEDA